VYIDVGNDAFASPKNRSRMAVFLSGLYPIVHRVTKESLARLNRSAEGRRSRCCRWLTERLAGIKFRRSSHGQADHGRQWSMPRWRWQPLAAAGRQRISLSAHAYRFSITLILLQNRVRLQLRIR
jgi:hypothetical protein